MPLSWNFDPVVRNWLIIGILSFYFLEWHFLAFFVATSVWWSEFDEDRQGFDLDEYIESHLDEFGHYDTWAGDVYKTAEKYGDVAENYARTHQTRHTLFRRLYKVRDDEVIKDFDYSYWEDNYEQIEKDILKRMREGLEEEKVMKIQYQKETVTDSLEDNKERGRHVYEQFLSSRVGEKVFSSSREDDGNIDATDIDDSGAELQYIFLLSEKMFEWIHNTVYDEKDSKEKDIEELWAQYILSEHDKKNWRLNYKNSYNLIKSRRYYKTTYGQSIIVDFQKELKMQPYPIFSTWLESPYDILIKRQRNKVDFDIITKLLGSSQPERVDIISENQKGVKIAEKIRQERNERIRLAAIKKQEAWDRAYEAYNISVQKSYERFKNKQKNEEGMLSTTSLITPDKKPKAKPKVKPQVKAKPIIKGNSKKKKKLMPFIQIQKSFENYIEILNKANFEKILNDAQSYKKCSFKDQTIFIKNSIESIDKVHVMLYKNLIPLTQECIEKFNDSFISKETKEMTKTNLTIFKDFLIESLPCFLREEACIIEMRAYLDAAMQFETEKLSLKDKEKRFDVHMSLISSYISYIKERTKDYKFIYGLYKVNKWKF